MSKYYLGLDQGTTGTTALLLDENWNVVSRGYKEQTQYYPKPGWVEHNPIELWNAILESTSMAIQEAKIKASDIKCIGLDNQGETVMLWNKISGEPVYNAIVWQCRRTADIIEQLKKDGMDKIISQKTGLIPDAYFSATKIKWILDNVAGVRERAQRGELLFGNVDTWLIWNLTKGKVHVTDYTNASRTMIFNINTFEWDNDIIEYFDIPKSLLPKVEPSSCIYGYTEVSLFGEEIPISGAGGDQQCALFGQGCTHSGDVKNTYGTGCFLLMNTGDRLIHSSHGLLTTISAGSTRDYHEYALEGSVFVGGAVIQWIRDELRMIRSATQTQDYANRVKDTAGMYIVPAFSGMGAPYWNQYARGITVGLTRGTSKEHFIRASLESIAYQSYDVINAMQEDAQIKLTSLKVDGGASANDFLMQFQADIINEKVIRPQCIETTALGAAYLAGLAVGYWKDTQDIQSNWKLGTQFQPNMKEEERQKRIKGWEKAVKCAIMWSELE